MTENEAVPEIGIQAQTERIKGSKKGEGGDKALVQSILALSAEHVRLELIRKLGEGEATLQRPTSAQNEVEALYRSVAFAGVDLQSVNYYIIKNRELSPGAGGRGIDSYLKVLTPVPTFAMPGAATEEEKGPGFFAKILAFILGTKKEETAK